MPELLTEQEQALWRAFAMMSRRLAAALESRLQREAGISVPDFEILQALRNTGSGQVRAGELGAMLSWEKSRISHHVARMETRGLVERTSCEDDLRGRWVTAAPAGREALERATPIYHDEVRRSFFAPLSRADETALGSAAMRILDASDAGECQGQVEQLGGAMPA